jgi:hypothetical protein
VAPGERGERLPGGPHVMRIVDNEPHESGLRAWPIKMEKDFRNSITFSNQHRIKD